MVQTRWGLMKEKISEVVEGDEASNAADKGSNPAENPSMEAENASMPAEKTSMEAEEASIESEKRSICGDEEEGGTRVPEPSSPVVEEAEEREMVPEAIEEEKEEDRVPESMSLVVVEEKAETVEEDQEQEEEETAEAAKGGEMDSSKTNSDEEPVAMEPLAMYFPPSEYTKKIKISTRCHLVETKLKIKQLEEQTSHPLTVFEKDWFDNHPQFKHILHLPAEDNHKVMGIWMLLLRTARIDKKKEVWFVVNGVPIRYSLREHALFSGLDCRSYPMNYAKAGSDRFKEKHFKDIGRIRVQDVREKLESMKPGRRSHERLKMLVLYFICTILVGQRKNTGEKASPVDPFLLRAVDDLEFCTKFPWGRYSFDYMLRMISHTMTHFRGVVAKEGITWPVPGFCIPLEFLAFEAIPALGKECIEENPDADENCPRLCRIRFKKSLLKGWTLQEINDQLGTTREIDSIIPAIGQEKDLLRRIMDDGEEDDVHDVVVDSWMRRMGKGLLVSFEDMYQADVDSRLQEENVVEEDEPNEPRVDNIELVDALNNMKESIQNQLETILERLDGLETRIWVLEADVGLLKGNDYGSTSQATSGKKKKKNKKNKNKRESETDITTHETKAKKTKRV